jgi:DNA-binding MarR family transcriptional regulator
MAAPDRAKLVAELTHEARVGSLWTVLIHSAIASRSGINVTDMQCINLLQLRGPMTPGQLADAMFITTGGAITAVLDRLEKAGMVRRRRDEEDRRRVIVEVTQVVELGARFAPVGERYEKLLEDFTDEQLEFLLDYLTRANASSPQVIEQIKQLD